MEHRYADRWVAAGAGGVAMLAEARDFAFEVSLLFILGLELEDEEFLQMRKDFDVFSMGLFAPDLGPVGPYNECKKARARMVAVLTRAVDNFMPLYNAGTVAPLLHTRVCHATSSFQI